MLSTVEFIENLPAGCYIQTALSCFSDITANTMKMDGFVEDLDHARQVFLYLLMHGSKGL